MKVVIFCGGQGMRMREASESIPKPMIPIGSRPILWHIMKFYAHHGHTDFVLCLGYKSEVIKHFFIYCAFACDSFGHFRQKAVLRFLQAFVQAFFFFLAE